jgi:outer membrane protein OmpA-like peptidoglycan-associated protein
MAGHTGNLWRPTFDVGVGIDAAVDQNHSVWMGPFLRYTQVLQTSYHQDGVGLDRSNPALLQAGLSVSFDFPTRTKVRVVKTHDVEVRTVQVVVHDRPVVAQAAPAPEKFELTEHVYFDFDKATLRWESRDKLDVVARKLNEHPNLILLVEGHASADGQLSHNQELASRRTQAVVNYLVSHGVKAFRLQGRSFGVNYPAASNSNQEGRERNRRVEFEVNFTSK